MIDGRFRHEHSWIFWQLDALVKQRITKYNRVSVRVDEQGKKITHGDIEKEKTEVDPFAKFGEKVPSNMPNSRNYWTQKLQELLALSEELNREPDFMITLTQNDYWPELQAAIKGGPGATWTAVDKKEEVLGRYPGEMPVLFPVEMAKAFYRRFDMFMTNIIRNRKGPFGIVQEYWWRVEYQKRGGLHIHMVVWCKPGTVPANVISAEMPRFKHDQNEHFRDRVQRYMIHNCREFYCRTGAGGRLLPKCRHGFDDFVLLDADKLDNSSIRWQYRRTAEEDLKVASYNLESLMCWDGHVNVQRVTPKGWPLYLAKYVAKSSVPSSISILDRRNLPVPPAASHVVIPEQTGEPVPNSDAHDGGVTAPPSAGTYPLRILCLQS